MAKQVSQVQQRFALLDVQLQRIRQSTIKGLTHTVDVNGLGNLFVSVKYYGVALVEFYIAVSGRKIKCKDWGLDIPVELYHVADKAYRHAAKFVKLVREYK